MSEDNSTKTKITNINNILIKLMSIVSLVIAPTLADIDETKNSTDEAAKTKTERSIQSDSNKSTTLKVVTIK